jgi:LPPG:FO 2-phospho-L-lactate transferase
MKVVYLSGGVGGARLAHGLAHALPPGELSIVVNTGDDFWHWGLRICPDLDTVMYTLADLGAVERGWGLADESFAALEWVKRYGGDSWFALGDRDLATHLMRTQWLRDDGQDLTQVTARLCQGLGVAHTLLPMSDTPYETLIELDGRTLPFQRWLVQERALPDVRAVRFAGEPSTSPALRAALDAADVVVIGPSNPYVSIDPILACPGVRERVALRPVIAVSPIVRGQAVKGPLARMLHTLAGAPASPASIAAHYGSLLNGLVGEVGDELPVQRLPCHAAHTVMTTRAASLELAREVLAFAERMQELR